MYSIGANTSDKKAAAVVKLVKKIGSINELILCSIALALSPVIRNFLKNFVKKCTLSELAIVIRMIGIDVFIIEKTNRSDPVNPLIQPMDPIIPMSERIITKSTINTPATLRRLASSIITIMTNPIRTKNMASARTKLLTIPTK